MTAGRIMVCVPPIERELGMALRKRRPVRGSKDGTFASAFPGAGKWFNSNCMSAWRGGFRAFDREGGKTRSRRGKEIAFWPNPKIRRV